MDPHPAALPYIRQHNTMIGGSVQQSLFGVIGLGLVIFGIVLLVRYYKYHAPINPDTYESPKVEAKSANENTYHPPPPTITDNLRSFVGLPAPVHNVVAEYKYTNVYSGSNI
jgi:hypothetical protein